MAACFPVWPSGQVASGARCPQPSGACFAFCLWCVSPSPTPAPFPPRPPKWSGNEAGSWEVELAGVAGMAAVAQRVFPREGRGGALPAGTGAPRAPAQPCGRPDTGSRAILPTRPGSASPRDRGGSPTLRY